MKMQKTKTKQGSFTAGLVTLAATLALVGSFACSSGPVVQDFPDTASAPDEVTKFSSDLANAKSRQVDVLSPENYKNAEQQLKKAQSNLSNPKDSRDTLGYVAKGRAYLELSNEFAKLAHSNIQDVVLARQAALTVGAPVAFPKEFRQADAQLIDVTEEIEKNSLTDALAKRKALQLTYLDLELRSIKSARLDAARLKIKQAIDEGAKEFAPRSLAKAEKSVADADAVITASRHDLSRIGARTQEANRDADHLVKITRDAKSGKDVSAEDTALRIEASQKQVAQGKLLNSALTSENMSLESKEALNRVFEEAQGEFEKSEAEVYKQGNTLTIRLRALEFPAAQASLKAKDFALLAKVQKVIRSFGKSSVVVEGHTDSIGGKEKNAKLSLSRAQAVKEYLVSTGEEMPAEIQAVGLDYQKPLASNKTATGRAQNRRVDVVIRAATDDSSSE